MIDENNSKDAEEEFLKNQLQPKRIVE